ncbi:MAG: glycosyltransferase [Promethearchaeota archaeon]
MNILFLTETDWLNRGPHSQHHIFDRLSKNPFVNVTVIDYDIDKNQRSNSLLIKKQEFINFGRSIKNSKVKVIRTMHLQIPFIRRISSLITNFFEILKIIRKNRPDIIVGNSMTNSLIGLIFAKVLNIPYFFFYIDKMHKLIPISYIQEIGRFWARISLKYSDKVIALTKFLRNYVINEGALPQNVIILPNGISLKNTIVDDKKLIKLKSKLSILDDDFVIFFMGYLYDFAGLKEIIEHYNSEVKNGKYNLKFLILGDGGIYNNLKNYVEINNADWVILAGHVPFFDITEYIHLADLCLLSFKINDITREIVPIKIIEYLAMKKPVLSNSLPGVIHEIGKIKGIIYAKNQKDLILKIKELLTQKFELKKIGELGYQEVVKKYLWQNIINDFKKIMIKSIRKRIKKK